MIDFHEAVKQMHAGKIVQFEGKIKTQFAMFRGAFFSKEGFDWVHTHMLYDPGFRYSLTGETINPKDWPPIYADKKHESHKSVRSSDASTFDFICDDCGATDDVTGGWGTLRKPCKGAK